MVYPALTGIKTLDFCAFNDAGIIGIRHQRALWMHLVRIAYHGKQ